MVTTQHTCAKCGSEQIHRNGHSSGYARSRCNGCGHQARFVPAAAECAARYGQVEKLLAERNSQRSIVRVTGVARMPVAKLAKKAQQARPAFTPWRTSTWARSNPNGWPPTSSSTPASCMAGSATYSCIRRPNTPIEA